VTARSPYETVAPDVLHRLHPRLRAYVGAIPEGHVGIGEGVFTVAGTPRPWFRPVLALLALDAVMFPAWERDVPFRVENRPITIRPHRGGTDLEARPAIRAHRTFRFRSGERVMVDAIAATPTGLADLLGRSGRLRAGLSLDVVDGAMRLVSTSVSVAMLGREWRLPSVIAPRVHLTEGFDDQAGMQRVSLRLEAPFLGTLYRYEGAFEYTIVPDAPEHRRPS
jgi:hypothetical protein